MTLTVQDGDLFWSSKTKQWEDKDENMQELIPINESEFVVYNHKTKEYLPIILNTRVISIQIMEELKLYIIG